jgi:hypothetical protein
MVNMAESFEIAKNISIKEAGKNEYWLQDQIYENPVCLGLGDLEAIDKERRQSSGGRLDILLKDPEDDTMYEVEIMLGETDESHIIRTIEYWDNESRRFPQRQHYAVLVAEHINRRFFNVIHLLSNTIPIIAIQASLLESHGKQSLFFSKILDTYEEIDDGGGTTTEVTRDVWIKKSKWTVETADHLFEICKDKFISAELNYVGAYIGINNSGYNYLWLHKRTQNKSLLGIRLRKEELHDKIKELLEQNNIPYNQRRKKFFITVNKQMIENNLETFQKIFDIVKENYS